MVRKFIPLVFFAPLMIAACSSPQPAPTAMSTEDQQARSTAQQALQVAQQAQRTANDAKAEADRMGQQSLQK
ncbi:MAG TPA: alanine-zipper protein [Stellaceae bacterium]|nr:alanine-zipper protein [Stellaceae bacterium]